MEDEIREELAQIFEVVRSRDPSQGEFLQAVHEVTDSLLPFFLLPGADGSYPNKKYLRVLASLCEPDRIIQFRVPWFDDHGNFHTNRGFRVQFNQSIGPYKGGLRFHPTVTQSVMKFLGFEQTFKNALTGLAMGGGKGGSDFNPKGKSDGEVARFCTSFMTELSKYIGADTDVPAGDIGVGAREIGYLFGAYKRITGLHEGVLTGKGMSWGGSNIRPEATGFGVLYITQYALSKVCNDDSLAGKRVALSGSGNVATFAALKTYDLGGVVVSMSDSGGCVVNNDGFTLEEVQEIISIKNRRGRIREFAETCERKDKNVFYEREPPWRHVRCDIVIPAATQNEVNEGDATALCDNGCRFAVEGANMPSTAGATTVFKDRCVFFIPAKAANAGGVAVSGLEMAQNSQRVVWSRERVDEELQHIMVNIFDRMQTTCEELGVGNDFQLGANVSGFVTVADSMFNQGAAF